VALNARQARFVAEYLKDPNATKAAKAAGYSEKTAYSQGHDLLKKPEIAAAVARMKSQVEREAIATRQERQEFWTRTMRGEGDSAELRDRLKASELLGKSEEDFTEKVKHSGGIVFRVVTGIDRGPDGGDLP
jgi:phage terminase small subunit